MSNLVQITDNLWVRPEHVAAVKHVGDEKCAVFMVGQSAVDGNFLVERNAEELVEELDDAMEDE